MNEQRIKTILGDHPWAALVRCEHTVTSTNALVKALAAQGLPEGTALLAETQSAGRGRLGRSFYSPAGSGLYLSVLLRPGKLANELLDLTARVAVCVQRAISDTCGFDAGIKWVNDLCLHGKKLGGILTELTGGERPAVIIGIGINCDQTKFPSELTDIASSVYAETGVSVDREALAAAILRRLSTLYETDWLPAYRQHCVTLGKPVKVLFPQGEKEAFAVDVTDTAALLVEYPDGTREEISSGEVSVRGLYGYLADTAREIGI